MDIYRWWSWLLLWKQNPRVHGSMVRAADCRSAGPWFNFGWRSWFIFMTGSDNLMNHPAQRHNIMSPIRTVITTITRKSVKMVAEPSNDTVPSRIPDTATGRLEDNSTVAKAATATAVALDTKARAEPGKVVQLKSELAQYQQSRTNAKVLHAIALKSPSEFGADTVVGRVRGRLAGESLDRLGNLAHRLSLQSQEQNSRATRSTGQGSVDHRHRRLEDDERRSHECHSHAVHSTSTVTHERQHTRCVGVCLKKRSSCGTQRAFGLPESSCSVRGHRSFRLTCAPSLFTEGLFSRVSTADGFKFQNYPHEPDGEMPSPSGGVKEVEDAFAVSRELLRRR